MNGRAPFGWCAVWVALASALPPQLPSGTVSGRVVDERGRPLAGVAVVLLAPGDTTFVTDERTRAPLATTDANGLYAAELPFDAADGLLYVTPGRVHVAGPPHPHDGWPVVLPPGRTLAGRVVDEHGAPVAGARGEARDWLWEARYRSTSVRYAWLPEPRTAVRTDAHGRFVLPGTVDAGIALTATTATAAARLAPVAIGDDVELVLVAFPPDGPPPARAQLAHPRLVVRAVNATGRPVDTFRCAVVRTVPGASEHATWRDFGASWIEAAAGVARPIARGTGTIRFDVLVVAPGMAATRQELVVHVPADHRPEVPVDEVTVQLAPEIPLRGAVVDANGAPVHGASVWPCRGLDVATLPNVWRDPDARPAFDSNWGHAVTDSDGTFVLRHVAPGAQHVVVRARGFRSPLPVLVELQPGAEPLRIVLARAGPRGTTGLAAGLPLGASVAFRESDQIAIPRSSQYERSAPIDADGTFVVPVDIVGNYLVDLVVPRPLQQGGVSRMHVGSATFRGMGPAVAIDVRPPLPGRVHGRARGPMPPGRLLVGAHVPHPQARRTDGVRYACALAPLAPDGSFSVPSPPGVCTLFVLDLWTGVLLPRAAPRLLRAGGELQVDLDVAAAPFDVACKALDPRTPTWLEVRVDDEWLPLGIDGMERVVLPDPPKSAGVGAMLPPGVDRVRLWLPPGPARLWLLPHDRPDTRVFAGETWIDATTRTARSAELELPR